MSQSIDLKRGVVFIFRSESESEYLLSQYRFTRKFVFHGNVMEPVSKQEPETGAVVFGKGFCFSQ